MKRTIPTVVIFLSLAFTARALLARGAVEIQAPATTTSVSTEEIQRLPVGGISGEVLRLTPNAAGVASFAGDAGRYDIETSRGDPASRYPVEIEDGTLNSYRLDPGHGFVRLRDPIPANFQPLALHVTPGYNFEYRIHQGLMTLEFHTPYGSLFGSGSELQERGKPSTWSSTLAPAGSNPKQVAKNAKALRRLDFVIGKGVHVPPDGAAQVTLSGLASVEVLKGSKTVVSGSVPVLYGDSATVRNSGLLIATTKRPPMGFAGDGVTIPGVFDGDARNTRMSFNGNAVRVVAESSFGASFYTPTDWSGLGNLTVSEGGQTWSMPVRSLGLKIWADRTDLKRGEKSVCHVKLTGLQGYEGRFTLAILNHTPGVIALAGSNHLAIDVDRSNGAHLNEFQLDRPFVGVHTGHFQIEARLITEP